MRSLLYISTKDFISELLSHPDLKYFPFPKTLALPFKVKVWTLLHWLPTFRDVLRPRTRGERTLPFYPRDRLHTTLSGVILGAHTFVLCTRRHPLFDNYHLGSSPFPVTITTPVVPDSPSGGGVNIDLHSIRDYCLPSLGVMIMTYWSDHSPESLDLFYTIFVCTHR